MIKRVLICLGILAFLGVTCIFLILEVYVLPVPERCSIESYDALIVLGGRRGDRAKLAHDLYKNEVSNQIFITGDGGKVLRALDAYGISKSKIVHEDAAESTIQNAGFTEPLLVEHDVKKALIVTSWFHANRSLRIFQATMPELEFCVAFPPRPSELNRYEKRMVYREKLACFYVTFLRGIYCLT